MDETEILVWLSPIRLTRFLINFPQPKNFGRRFTKSMF